MKTILNIDDTLLKEAMAASGARTKTEAIEAGLREIIALKRRKELAGLYGGMKGISTPRRRRTK